MTIDQIRNLSERGHTIASHTMSHKDIGTICTNGEVENARTQIWQSKMSFEHEGLSVEYFTFPHGNHSKKAIEIVKE